MMTNNDPVTGADQTFDDDEGFRGAPRAVMTSEPRFVDAPGARRAILTDRQRDRPVGMAAACVERWGEATLTMRDIRANAGIVVAYERMDRSRTGGREPERRATSITIGTRPSAGTGGGSRGHRHPVRRRRPL
jgi:hypothetical protein